MALNKCNVSPRATSKQLLPSRKQHGGFNLVSLYMFFQVCLKTTESKRDEKYTAGNRKCLGKFLNFKIVYFVLFLSQNTIVV